MDAQERDDSGPQIENLHELQDEEQETMENEMVGDGACEMFGDYFDGEVENLRRGSMAMLHGNIGFSNKQVE